MNKIVKKVVAAVIILLLTLPLTVSVGAADYGAAEIENALPEEIVGELYENSGVLSLTAENIFGEIIRIFTDVVGKPLKLLASLAAVILMCAVAASLRDSTGSSAAKTAFEIVAVLAGAGMVIKNISEAIAAAEATMQGGGTFMLAFIPIYAGVIAVNGQALTAGVFNSVFLVATQVMSQILVTLLLPLCTCTLGVSIAAAINPDLKINSAAEAVKKLVVFALGLIMTVFIGLLSLQSFVSVSADSVAMKAAKFTVSNAVPIVGSAVSDALSTVKGSLGVLRGSMGTFGIIASAMLIAPTLITALCYKGVLTLSAALAELLGTDRLASLLKSAESVVTILLAMLVCFLLLIVISVALMLAVGGYGGI